MKYDKILFISVDALSSYYSRVFEKYFNVKYQNALSTYTWTLPSHLSMLSSVNLPELVTQMRVKDTHRYKNYIQNIPTIATVLKRNGFICKAWTGGGYMSKYFGWGSDFNEWKDADAHNREWEGEKVIVKKGEFVFLHTYFIHNWFEENRTTLQCFIKQKKLLEEKNIVDHSFFNTIGKKLYVKRIEAFSKKLAWLNDLDLKTLVILTSDHGELFFEDDKNCHHGNLARTTLDIYKVPLLVRSGKTKRIQEEYVHLFQVPFLIKSLLGIKQTRPRLGM